MSVLQPCSTKEHEAMPKVQELYILERGLNRKARAQSATALQKLFTVLISIIIIGSFIMMCLQAVGIAQPDLPFSHIMVSMISLLGGYLFGNNVKISM